MTSPAPKAPVPAASRSARRLAGIPSPYLALYVDDPIDWWPWGAEAVDEARRSQRPLLVSVGFFACHWCHVLHKESLRDAQIAELINRDFVPVKVDREVHGALDAALQNFAHSQVGRRGWPLQVLVTPEGYPVEAGLYEPRAAFFELMLNWSGRWRADPLAMQRHARALVVPAASAPPRVQADAAHARSLGLRVRSDALRRADQLQGGFNAVAKMSSAPQLLALLDLQQRHPDEMVAEFLILTLEQMQTQGLRDHVWGGFFRYTIDPSWREPHFEKMSADNALLALVYLRAAALMRRPDWRRLALETLAFMRRELWDARAGAFASSLSAQDAQGREGARYLWSAEQLRALLPDAEHDVLTRVWDTRSVPTQSLGHLPMQAHGPDAREARLLASAYARLRAGRAQTLHPRDDKLLAGVNGLALAALAEAAAHDRAAAAAAQRLARFITTRLWDGRRLLKFAGGAQGGELDDYAFVALGLARQARATNSASLRALCAAVATRAWALFHRQGWHREAEPLLAGIGAETTVADSDVPSSSATLILASLDLGDALAARARQALTLGGRPALGAALGWGTQWRAMDRALRKG